DPPGESAPLVGRDDLLARLLEGARAAIHDCVPTLATVLGEPGHGKSRLRAALVKSLATSIPDVEILDASASESPAFDSQAQLRHLPRHLLGLGEEPPPDLGRGQAIAEVGAELGEAAWPALALRLGWLSSDAPAVRALAAAPGTLRTL